MKLYALDLDIGFCIFQLIFVKIVSSSSYQTTANLTLDVLVNYHKNIRPVRDQSMSIGVTLNWYPNLMIEFNDVFGILTIMSAAILTWNDELIQWNKSDINETSIKINADRVWVPYLGVVNGVESVTFQESDFKNGQVTYGNTGDATFPSVAVTKTHCQPNMFYFPFDEHNCTVIFYPKGYVSSEVFFTNESKCSFIHLAGDKRFDIKKYYTNVQTDPASTISLVMYTLLLQRRSSFIVLNYCSPIVTLSFLNVFVFLLPVESGERISYSVTLFLSLAVFLTIVAEKLPDNDPIPIFTYFLIGKIFYSSMILLCTIASVRCYYADKSSFFLKTLQRLLDRFSTSRSHEGRQIHRKRPGSYNECLEKSSKETSGERFIAGSSREQHTGNALSNRDGHESMSTDEHEAWSRRWKQNANTFDKICSVVFFALIACETILWATSSFYYLH